MVIYKLYKNCLSFLQKLIYILQPQLYETLITVSDTKNYQQ